MATDLKISECYFIDPNTDELLHAYLYVNCASVCRDFPKDSREAHLAMVFFKDVIGGEFWIGHCSNGKNIIFTKIISESPK